MVNKGNNLSKGTRIAVGVRIAIAVNAVIVTATAYKGAGQLRDF